MIVGRNYLEQIDRIVQMGRNGTPSTMMTTTIQWRDGGKSVWCIDKQRWYSQMPNGDFEESIPEHQDICHRVMGWKE